MSVPALPLSTLRVSGPWRHAAERGRLALYLSAWLTVPTALWLVVSDELKLLAAGLIGAALMPLVLQIILFPAHLLARKHSRPRVLASAAFTAASLSAWTWAAAGPVLEREHLPFPLRLLWAYCVAVLPLAMMASADEDSFPVFVSAAQVQIGVLALAAAQAGELSGLPRQAALSFIAVAATWAVQNVWFKTHPSK